MLAAWQASLSPLGYKPEYVVGAVKRRLFIVIRTAQRNKFVVLDAAEPVEYPSLAVYGEQLSYLAAAVLRELTRPSMRTARLAVHLARFASVRNGKSKSPCVDSAVLSVSLRVSRRSVQRAFNEIKTVLEDCHEG